MITRLALFLLLTLHLTAAVAQDPAPVLQIEKEITTTESIIAARVNISEYIRPLFADDGGGIFLKHHYTIDTVKSILYKAVYEYVDFEQVTFYYHDQKVIKAFVSDTSSKGNSYQCEYYFDNGSTILIKENGRPARRYLWNAQEVISQSEEYVIDFAGICNLLDRRK